jgi:hypothetical protein
VVVLDEDDDPRLVMSPQSYKRLAKLAAAKDVDMLGPEFHFDAETIPS